jgi:conjugative coupling factor TraD (SXT/TOL subfamily)
MQKAFENHLRPPLELWVSLACLCATAWLVYTHQHPLAILCLLTLAVTRAIQGLRIHRYHQRLCHIPHWSCSTTDIPISPQHWFMGKGFRFCPKHRQRLHLLAQIPNQRYIRHTPSAIGGKPWLHGVGSDQETTLYLPQANRNSHTVVFGMTRVGKTRLMSILVNQDIRNHEPVLVIDPKGDLDLLQSMFDACQAAGRLNDLIIVHPGIPEYSAKYNPLANYAHLSEIATRVTQAMDAQGEGKVFQDFAWKFLNTITQALSAMGEPISYQSLSTFITRPKALLLRYCDHYFTDTDYTEVIEEESTPSHRGKKRSRTDIACQYVAHYLERQTTPEPLLTDLHYAAQLDASYYDKITASLMPILDKINQTSAGSVFSWDGDHPSLTLSTLIQERQVAYIALDALSNRAMCEAVGQAVIADLISLCGRAYKAQTPQNLCLHADEFSDIVREDFITLLNKAGGAGIQVTAYTQTVNDLGAAFGRSQDKPKMLLGNFGTTIMMRIANQDTARVFTNCLETIHARSTTPMSIVNDQTNTTYNTTNADQIQETPSTLITDNDLFSLPKGQAFVLTNGGELYKIRLPLPQKTHTTSFQTLMQTTINHRRPTP